ncbi:MAG: C1 family peptidase [Prevotella sp.]|nr:C1 family peptidase [Prevotella sp.]
MRNNLSFPLLLCTLLCCMTAGAQPVSKVPFRTTIKTDIELPASVDNSTLKYFPPIINQSGGSCAQAAGIAYMLTYEVNRLLDRDASASADNRLSYMFAWNMLNDGEDQGGFVSQGLQLARQYGIMTEQDYGYLRMFKWVNGYEKYVRAMRHRVATIYTYDDSVSLMKRYLYDKGDGSATGGVLTFSGQSQGWDIENYQGPSETGYHALLTSLATGGSHAMTIVGYDDRVTYTDHHGQRHDGAFIVVNSWGDDWQDRGHFYLPYDFFRDPTVSSLVLSNTVEGCTVRIHEPQVVLRLTIDYSSRDDLSFSTGLSTQVTTNRPLQMRTSNAFRNQGGDLPMQGYMLPGEIELAIDLTEQMDSTKDYAQYWLDIVRGYRGKQKGEGRLVSLSVVDLRTPVAKEYPCRNALPQALTDGDNYFRIPLQPRYTLPASPYRYDQGDDTFLLRTTDGHPSKVQFENVNEQNQTITIRYEVKE